MPDNRPENESGKAAEKPAERPAEAVSSLIEKNPYQTVASKNLAQDKFLQQFLKYIRQNYLIETQGRVLVAVSGGLDSTVLAHLMARAARIEKILVEFVHVDHGTRVAASREGAWVKVLGDRLAIHTHLVTLPAETGKSQVEMRFARRHMLEELAQSTGAKSIATAHHADDNAETFLMRAISGTGVSGLGGISPREGLWVHPLLWATRDELESYAREHRLAWVEDPSNARGAYLRNRLRHEALPMLDSIRVGSVRNLSRIAERIDEEEREWEEWLNDQFDGPVEVLPRAWVEKWPDPLQRRVFKVWLKRLGLEHDPSLVEALIGGEELIHSAGSFLRRSDMFVFSRENSFGSEWKKSIPVELGKRIALGSSTAWSFVEGAPEKFRPLELGVYFLFRPPQMIQGRRMLFSWERLPWPLAIRKREDADDHGQLDRLLMGAKIPRPFWKNWPLVVSQENPPKIVALLGVVILPEFALQRVGRCVSMECFFEDRLKPLSPS